MTDLRLAVVIVERDVCHPQSTPRSAFASSKNAAIAPSLVPLHMEVEVGSVIVERVCTRTRPALTVSVGVATSLPALASAAL